MPDSSFVSPGMGVVIVCFNPDLAVVENIRTLEKAGCQIVVVDNCSGPDSDPVIERISSRAGLVIARQTTNLGLAEALNIGIEALCPDVEFIAFFDQDSICSEGYLDRMIGEFQRLESEGVPLGCLGPSFVDRWSGIRINRNANSLSVEKTTLFTSGLLLRAETFRSVGPFRTEFFVDHVDSDFTLRCRKAGYKNFQFNDETIRHELGNMTVHRVFGRTITTTNHSVSRRLSISRNRFRLWTEYCSTDPNWFWHDEIPSFAKDIIKILCLEKNKLAKMRAVVVAAAYELQAADFRYFLRSRSPANLQGRL